MKRIVLHFLLMTVLLGSLMAIACSAPAPSPAPSLAPSPAPAPKPTAAPAPSPTPAVAPKPSPAPATTPAVGPPPGEKWPAFVSIGSPSVGSSKYLTYMGIANMLKKYYNQGANCEAAGGCAAIVRLMGKGQMEMGHTMSPDLYEAPRGIDTYAKDGKIQIRYVWGSWNTFMHLIVKADSSIKSVTDLKGKRFMADARATSTIKRAGQELLKAYGMTTNDVIYQPIMSQVEGIKGLGDGTTDAIWWSGAIGDPPFVELATTMNVRFIPIGDKEAKAINASVAWLVPTKIPAGVYKGQTTEVNGVYVGSFISARADLPDSLIYAVMDFAFGAKYRDEFLKIHSICAEVTKEAMLETPPPYHAGAIKYFKDKGWWTDAAEKAQQAVLKELGQTR